MNPENKINTQISKAIAKSFEKYDKKNPEGRLYLMLGYLKAQFPEIEIPNN